MAVWSKWIDHCSWGNKKKDPKNDIVDAMSAATSSQGEEKLVEVGRFQAHHP
jgi:hypothetical protein